MFLEKQVVVFNRCDFRIVLLATTQDRSLFFVEANASNYATLFYHKCSNLKQVYKYALCD